MARCRTIQGDYEICPRNPIVSHRHMPLLNPISVTGHADIVETQNGEWWMVLLAVRPYEGGHYNLAFYLLTPKKSVLFIRKDYRFYP